MPQPTLQTHTRPSPAPLYLLAVFLLLTLIPLAQPLVSHQPWLVFEQDDFFYYLQIARNLAHALTSTPLSALTPTTLAQASTANGLVPTDGYHPLWLLLLTAACLVSTAGPWLASFLALTGLLATAATLLLSLHLLRRLAGLPTLAALPFAFATTVYALKLFFDGMEITLTIPLALASVAVLLHRFQPPATAVDLSSRSSAPAGQRSPRAGAPDRSTAVPRLAIRIRPPAAAFLGDLALGLLLSATVLSRLDSALLLALFTLGVLATPPLRRQLTPARLAALTLGLSPIAIYLLLNHHLFGTYLPISGLAKQLRTTHLPSSAVWESVTGPHPLSALKLLIPLATLALLPLNLRQHRPVPALPASAATSPHPAHTGPAPLRPIVAVILASLGLFPLVHLFVLSVLSDWRLWPWYLYPFRLALLSTLILVARLPAVRTLLLRPTLAVALASLGLLAVLASRRDTAQTTSILAVADDLTHFAHTHPTAIYAMGDRSGLVAYLLPDPLIQTEGLTMDPHFLSLIRAQTPLLDALRQLHVRYYIATVYLPPHTPVPTCLAVAEPFQAGPSSPHMRAILCARPVAHFLNGEFPTLVFDLNQLPAPEQPLP